MKQVSFETIAQEAADMLSEDGKNYEYDRAVIEFVARVCFPEWDGHVSKDLARSVITAIG